MKRIRLPIVIMLTIISAIALTLCTTGCQTSPTASQQQQWAAFVTNSAALTLATDAVFYANADLDKKLKAGADPLTIAAEKAVLKTANDALTLAATHLGDGTQWTPEETRAVAQSFLADINTALAAKGIPPIVIVLPPHATAPATTQSQ